MIYKALILPLIIIASLFAQQKKIPVAVMDLSAVGVSISDARIITSRLRTNLFKTNKFTVVEREAMNDILKEQGFQLSGCTNEECIVEAGRLLGVRLIIAGEIGKIGSLYTLSIRMIDVETGKILRTAGKDCKCEIEEVLTETVSEVALQLAGIKKYSDNKSEKTENESDWDFQLSAYFGNQTSDTDPPIIGLIAGYSKPRSWRLSVKYCGGSVPEFEWISNLTLQYEKLFSINKAIVLTAHIGAGMIGNVEKFYDLTDDTSVYEEESGFGIDIGVGVEIKPFKFLFIKPTINSQLGSNDASSFGYGLILGFLL